MNHVRLHEAFPLLPGMRVRARISPDILVQNYRALLEPVLRVSPHTRAIAVVKADAYGHGIRPCVGALYEAGCRSFAVACLEEAVALRRLLRELMAGRATDASADILVLGYTDPENAAILAAYNVTTALISEAYTRRLLDCARAARVTVKGHAALDTGMNRVGFPAHTEEELRQTVAVLTELFGPAGIANPRGEVRAYGNGLTVDERQGIVLDGLFTHFARADEDFTEEMTAPHSLTAIQYERYRRVLTALEANGIRPRVRHVCNSAAAIRFPETRPEGCLDAVRLGINLYGYGVELRRPFEGALRTRPVMRLETVVTHVHPLLPGETVGYGGTYVSDTPRILATLPVGYADGWLRAFSGASVTLHTPKGDMTAPIVGRICMDQCMADVTGLPVEAGTPVTLFGQSSAQLEALAERAHTIPYELLCLITARIPRVYP